MSSSRMTEPPHVVALTVLRRRAAGPSAKSARICCNSYFIQLMMGCVQVVSAKRSFLSLLLHAEFMCSVGSNTCAEDVCAPG